MVLQQQQAQTQEQHLQNASHNHKAYQTQISNTSCPFDSDDEMEKQHNLKPIFKFNDISTKKIPKIQINDVINKFDQMDVKYEDFNTVNEAHKRIKKSEENENCKKRKK